MKLYNAAEARDERQAAGLGGRHQGAAVCEHHRDLPHLCSVPCCLSGGAEVGCIPVCGIPQPPADPAASPCPLLRACAPLVGSWVSGATSTSWLGWGADLAPGDPPVAKPPCTQTCRSRGFSLFPPSWYRASEKLVVNILRKFSSANRNRRALPPKHLKNIEIHLNKQKKWLNCHA